VTTIPQKELRNNVGEVLRRVETGEQFTITVSGRPVAELGPIEKRRWVGTGALKNLVQTPAPTALGDDLERFPAAIIDPFH
jgi:prevent-host-death family protein